MKHYSFEEWNNFKTECLEEDLINEMQLHLLECDDCMNLYLSTISDDYTKDISKYLPDNFTQNIIDKIKLEDLSIIKTKKKNYLSNILIYYISAACITLFLMSQGVFHSMISNVPAASTVVANSTQRSERFLTNGWTDQLTQKTSFLLNGLFNINRRDSFEK